MNTVAIHKLITLEEVTDRIPFSSGHIYRLIRREEFPKQVKVGSQRVAWLECEVDAWIQERIKRSRT